MLLLHLAAVAAPPAWLVRPGLPVPPDAVVRDDGRRAALVQADPPMLEARGIQVRTRFDGTARGGFGWVQVYALPSELAQLSADGIEVQADRLRDLGPPPTDVTGPLVGVPAIQARPDGPTGEGVVIANLDTHIEITHPHFFRADAGAFSWVDVDGDGVLTPGVDGLDRDEDGQISPAETLEELEAFAWRWNPEAGALAYDQSPGELDPRRDWLYLDLDGDGQRDAGRPDFTDVDPGMAEPTFVPDDVDGDGVIEPGERVWQLGTSVVRAAYYDGRTFTRGEDLSAYDRQVESDRFHGTAVSGILVGGQLPAQRQFVGLAPDAELLFVSREAPLTGGDLLDFFDVVEGEGADVLLHEYAPWTGSFFDGSGPVEAAVDTLAERGMAQICPTGNLADAGKHGLLRPDGPGSNTGSLTLEPDRSVFWLEWHYKGPADRLSCQLEGPDLSLPLVDAETQLIEGPVYAWLSRYVSPLGNARSWLTVWRPDGGELTPGRWTLSCDAGEVMHAYVVDGSGWDRGSVFDDEVRASTMGLPSTAKHCVAVGAYSGQFAYGDDVLGDLRSWSSRGPALGGHKTVDVTAPDDAYAPSSWFAPGSDASYTLFGGTSGAAPHVAAVAALMKQAEPGLSGVAVRRRLRQSARQDGTVDPGDGWGRGRADGFAALYSGDPSVPPPSIELDVHWILGPGEPIAEVRGASDLRWDFGYDGTIDATGPIHEVPRGGVVRIDAYAEGYRVGGVVLDGVDARYEPEPRGGCATVPASASWLAFLGLLALRRRGAAGVFLTLAACGSADVEVLGIEDRGPLETNPDIQGRDGGYSARVGTRSVWAHGDTILGAEGEAGSWLNSSVSWTEDLDASDGITGFTEDLDSLGVPAQFFEPVDDVVWAGPVVEDPVRGGAIVAWQRLGDTEGTGLARWDGPGTTPERIQPDDWFGQVRVNTALVVDGGHLYALGCRTDGFGKPCTLSRASIDDALDPGAWSFWDGGDWASEPAAAAKVVGANDIASLHFSEQAGLWVLVYSEPLGRAVHMRTAEELTGPWSSEVHLFDAEPADDGALPYSAVAHGEYGHGEWTEVVTYHRGTEPWHSELRVVHVELALR